MSPALLDQIRAALPTGYIVDGYLDGGGQGTVLQGSFGRQPAAIKLFQPSHDIRRLDRELELLAAIDCPYLVKVLGVTRITLSGAAIPVVAYEFLAGGDLRSLVGTAPDKETLVGIGLNLATAVERLWAKRIVHRDIKPANIVRAAKDRFVLVDVGLARHLDRSALTAPGAAPCTPGYASPEQALGRRNLTINSDVFSLGVTLYEIGTGVHPFNRAQNLVGVISPTPVQHLRGDLDGPFAALVHQMMAVSPAARPAAIRSRFEQVR